MQSERNHESSGNSNYRISETKRDLLCSVTRAALIVEIANKLYPNEQIAYHCDDLFKG